MRRRPEELDPWLGGARSSTRRERDAVSRAARTARAAGAARCAPTARDAVASCAPCSAGEPPRAAGAGARVGRPREPILRWVADLRGVRLEIAGDDLLGGRACRRAPRSAAALEETLRRKLDGELVPGRDEELRTALELARERRDDRAARCPGARVLFSTRMGGVSEGPYESLNLGVLTDDDPAA